MCVPRFVETKMSGDMAEIFNKVRNVRSDEIPHHWPWIIALGILFVVLGVVGVGFFLSFKAQSLLMVGWFLLASGLLQGLHAFSRHPHQTFPFDVVDSTVYVVAGFLIVSDPIAGSMELTLLISGILMVKGIVKVVMASGRAISDRLPAISSGVVALILGIILWLTWPSAGLVILGSFVALEIAVTGWSLILRGFFEKRLIKRSGLHAV